MPAVLPLRAMRSIELSSFIPAVNPEWPLGRCERKCGSTSRRSKPTARRARRNRKSKALLWPTSSTTAVDDVTPTIQQKTPWQCEPAHTIVPETEIVLGLLALWAALVTLVARACAVGARWNGAYRRYRIVWLRWPMSHATGPGPTDSGRQTRSTTILCPLRPACDAHSHHGQLIENAYLDETQNQGSRQPVSGQKYLTQMSPRRDVYWRTRLIGCGGQSSNDPKHRGELWPLIDPKEKTN
jgi:hypothetical protein